MQHIIGSCHKLNNSLRFPGQYADGEGILNYNNHRYYDYWLGRYTQPDPIGLKGGLNSYTYAGDNPGTMVDPWGLVDINYFPLNDPLHRVESTYNPSDYYSVGGHGSPQSIQDGNSVDPNDVFGGKRNLTPQDVAGDMLNDPNYYPGEPVILHSCSTGKGENSFAQQLANLTGSPVTAPTDDLLINSNAGGVFQSIEVQNGGTMRTFTPIPRH